MQPAKPSENNRWPNISVTGAFDDSGWMPPWSWQTEKHFTIMGSNVTSWGPQARAYMKQTASDIVVLAEHRELGRKAGRMKKQLRAAGFRCAVAEAVPTENDTSADVMIAWKQHLYVEPLELGTALEAAGRAVYAKLNLKGGCSLYLVGLYLWTAVGLGPANLEALTEVGQTLQRLDAPWVAVGDWSLTPSQLREAGWLSTVKGHEITQPDIEGTCTTKATSAPTLLDYFVVSPMAFPLVAAKGQDPTTPWGTHMGVQLAVTRCPLQALSPMIFTPTRLDKAFATTSGQHEPEPWDWQHAWHRARRDTSWAKRPAVQTALQHLAMHPCAQASWSLGLLVAVWARSAEYWHLSRSPLPESDWNKYLGRGLDKRIKWQRASAKQLQPDTHSAASSLVLWGGIVARLKVKWRMRGV